MPIQCSGKKPRIYLEMGPEIFGLCRQVQDGQKRLVRVIFVDETLLQIDGKDYWLWIAYEPALNTCLMMHLSRERTIFVCYQFFKQLRTRYMAENLYSQIELNGTTMHV
jgi:hypothetical protein